MASPPAPTTRKRRRTFGYGVLGVLVFAGLLFVVLDCPIITLGIMGGPYKKALAQVGACQPARELLGDDVRLRTFGPAYGSSSGERGSFRIPVAGSKQAGILDYRWDDELEWTLFVGGEFTHDGFTGTTLKSADCEPPAPAPGEDDKDGKPAKGDEGDPPKSSSKDVPKAEATDAPKPEPSKDEPAVEPPKEEASKATPPKDEPTKDAPAKPPPSINSIKKKKPGK